MYKKSSNIKKLKEITLDLSPIEADNIILNKILSHAPLPISLWAVNNNGKVIMQKGNCIINSNSDNIHELFEGKDHEDLILGNFSKVMNDLEIKFMEFQVNEKDRIFTVKLFSDNEIVSGMAIDITSCVSNK
jgi:hypothetical protein